MRFFYYISTYLFIFIMVAIVFFPTGCKNTNNMKKTESLRFAIIGNTYSGSAFKSIGSGISTVFIKINRHNPLFVIHLGNMVYSGKDWMGIRKIDVSRQFEEFFNITARLKPILYTVKGEMDIFNNSSELYIKYTSRKDYYSFNYGNIHFLILDTMDKAPGVMSSIQMRWMRNDLYLNKSSEAIYIFTHHPLFVPHKLKYKENDIRCKNYLELHRFFLKYPVKAVISGNPTIFYKYNKDGIKYFITGCGGYNKRTGFKECYQYYLIEHFKEKTNIIPKRISEISID